MVYLERKRAAERDAAEAAGQNLWTEELDVVVRGRLVAYWHLFISNVDYVSGAVEEAIERTISLGTGRVNLPSIDEALHRGDVDLVLSYIDAIGLTFGRYGLDADSWQDGVAQIFQAHRVAYKFVAGEVVLLDSEELFASVIEPVVNLLHGHPELEEAHQAYRDALKQIAAGDPANAITDAGTALQATLKVLGFPGNQLGDQIRDAKKRGLLAPHDPTLNDGISKFLSWASADRSETGDAHHVTPATTEDAWLMVHIVGALIVRLAAGLRTSK